jgi:hypothetical protein
MYQVPQPDAAAGATVSVIPPLPAPPPGWYRCPTPGGYFPGVSACVVSWSLVQDPPPPDDGQ